jgi:hypothetical protein
MRVVFRCDPALVDVLPRPIPARQALPDWLRAMPNKAFSETHGQDVRTLKQCPPFVDAMIHGFMMPLACDVVVHDGKFEWDWNLPPPSVESHPRAPLSFHVPAQTLGSPLHDDARAAIKFNSFWTIELEPGYSLYATHPVNRADLPFRTLTGIVDGDRFNAVGILFPAVWIDPGFSGILRAGTPVAQCFPLERESLDLIFEPMSASKAQDYDSLAGDLLSKPGVYRQRFRASRPSSTQRGPKGSQVKP